MRRELEFTLKTALDGRRIVLRQKAGFLRQDRQAIIAVLRRASEDPILLAELRRWCHEIGLFTARSDIDLLQRLTDAIYYGRIALDTKFPEDRRGVNSGSSAAPSSYEHRDTPSTPKPRPRWRRPEAPRKAPVSRPPVPQREKTWIKIELRTADDLPIAGARFELLDAEGVVVSSGALDAEGQAHVDDLDRQDYKIRFPDYDKTMWEPA